MSSSKPFHSSCVNPFRKEKHYVTVGLRSMTDKQLLNFAEFSTGAKVRSNCRKALYNFVPQNPEKEQTEVENDSNLHLFDTENEEFDEEIENDSDGELSDMENNEVFEKKLICQN